MSDNISGNGKGILVAAIVGAAVGAGVALLFAPYSGKDTRGWLADRTQELKGRTTDVYEKGKASIRKVAKEIGRDGETVASTMRP